MKIVVIDRPTNKAPYQVLRMVGYVAAVFSLAVCLLMMANTFNVKRLDPMYSPALAKLMEQLKANPKDEALREEIRELDLLTRQAFFSSQHFTHLGVPLLVGGLVVVVVCFKSLTAYKAVPPYPDSKDPKEDLTATALWARKSVTAVGLVLLGFALMLALPWKSPLDRLATSVSGGNPTMAPVAAPVAPKPSAVAPKTAAATWPTFEELQAQWPGFRGANGGLTRAGNVPTTWEPDKGAAWKNELPLPGMNSPVVWKDSVLMAGADEASREVYCVDAATGKLRWKQTVSPIAGATKKALQLANDTGYAPSTMATDGTRAFVIFVDGELAAFTLDGKPAWQRNLGLPESAYGYASSLATFEDLLIVQMDRQKDSYIAGLDAATGKERWKTPRKFGPSWASPQIIHGPQGPLLLTAATPYLVAYEPRTGKELWRVECLKDAEVAVSPFYGDGVIYVASDANGFTAIDVATQKVLWQKADGSPSVCTPLVTKGLIIYGSMNGGIFCLDAKTGAELWHQDTDDGIYASPILVGENVYLIDRAGKVHVCKADRSGFQAVGSPAVGEQVYATPAVVGNGLFVRGVKSVYRFGI